MTTVARQRSRLWYDKKVLKRSVARYANQLLRHVVPAVLRPLHTLWHEIIGFLFLALAAVPIPSGIKAIREYDGDPGTLVKLILSGIFISIMGGYGISSFLRARRISRS